MSIELKKATNDAKAADGRWKKALAAYKAKKTPRRKRKAMMAAARQVRTQKNRTRIIFQDLISLSGGFVVEIPWTNLAPKETP